MTSACVRRNQKLLHKLGFDPGPIDGIYGRRTLLAYREATGVGGVPDRDELRTNVVGGRQWPRQRDMADFYGRPGKNHVRLTCPYPLRIAWDLRQTINSFTINRKCADSAGRVLQRALDHYGYDEIKRLRLDVFGGCYNNRKMRGGSRLSTHAYAAAIDFDPTNNQLRWKSGKAKLAGPEYLKWWSFWEAEGWVPLGRARDFDWMHVQAARL